MRKSWRGVSSRHHGGDLRVQHGDPGNHRNRKRHCCLLRASAIAAARLAAVRHCRLRLRSTVANQGDRSQWMRHRGHPAVWMAVHRGGRELRRAGRNTQRRGHLHLRGCKSGLRAIHDQAKAQQQAQQGRPGHHGNHCTQCDDRPSSGFVPCGSLKWSGSGIEAKTCRLLVGAQQAGQVRLLEHHAFGQTPRTTPSLILEVNPSGTRP